MSRRDMMLGVGAIASVAASGVAWAEGKHEHAKHATRHPKLVDSLAECVTRGQLCISHCLVTFSEGDTTLAACARKVQETLAICQALSYLAASNSPYLEETAKVCLAACQDCSKECEKHAEKHAECRDCMEACDDVVAKLKKLVA